MRISLRFKSRVVCRWIMLLLLVNKVPPFDLVFSIHSSVDSYVCSLKTRYRWRKIDSFACREFANWGNCESWICPITLSSLSKDCGTSGEPISFPPPPPPPPPPRNTFILLWIASNDQCSRLDVQFVGNCLGSIKLEIQSSTLATLLLLMLQLC